MKEMRPFEYTHEGLLFIGRLAMPPGTGPHPGVLVMHDGQGVGEFVCRRAQDLAAAGYVALATDMFGGGKRFKGPAESTPVVMALRNDGPRLRERVVASYDAFRTLPEVDASRIGAIGYCFGGQCVLELARSGADAKAVVSFHGTLGTHQPARLGALNAKALVLTGALDPFVPPKDVEAFQNEITAAGANWQMTIYGGGKHGFTDPIADEMSAMLPGVGYDPLLDRLSWAQAMAFLEAIVRAG
jgi:dienelactone hydrolase